LYKQKHKYFIRFLEVLMKAGRQTINPLLFNAITTNRSGIVPAGAKVEYAQGCAFRLQKKGLKLRVKLQAFLALACLR